MVGKQNTTPQLNIFDTPIKRFINLNHELCILSHQIDWDSIEGDFSVYYSDIGRPSVPICRMVGLLLLKHIYNLSDEAVVGKWIENPYWQYFSGEQVFQTNKPFDPTEFIHFRNRIGKEGVEKLLKISVQLFGKEAQEKAVLIDSTVQEKNITYPTDAKLHKRVIEKVNKIAKGKEAKKFEFGNKTGIVLIKTSKIVVGALAFENNPYDGHTLEEHLKQTEYLTEKRPKVGIVDRGYRGKKKINGTEIVSPSIAKKDSSQYQKQKARKRFRARAGIEPVIGHIKHDHRMLRNYLKGTIGDQLNSILAGTGFNLKKMLNRIKEQILIPIFGILKILILNSFLKIYVQKNILLKV